MSLDLSHGFPAESQVDTRVVQQIFAGNFLSRVGVFKATQGDGSQLTVWFDQPELTLVRNPDPAAASVEVRLLMTARASNRIDEGRVAVTARGRIVDRKVAVDGKSRACPAVDFNQSSPGDFVVGAVTSAYDAIVLPFVIELLRKLSPLALGPLASGIGTRTYCTYFDVEGHTDGLLVMFVSPFVAGPTPPTVTGHVSADTDAVLIVPDDLVNPAIAAGMTTAGLGSLPAQLNPDVRVNRLSVSLQNGHILMDGAGTNTTEVLGIDIDTDFSFKVFAQPLVQGGVITMHVLSTQQDLDGGLADFADFISAGALTRLMEEMVPKALEGMSLGTFAGLEFFSRTAPADDSAPASVSMIIRVLSNGLILQYDVEPSVPAAVRPAYFRGHLQSREFHVAGCKFGDLIKAKNARLFPTFEAALQKGYDGCATCQPDFNVASFGDLAVTVVHPSGVEADLPITLTADYEGTLMRFDVTLAPDRETTESKRPFDDGGVPTHSLSLSHIVPAKWMLTVECGDWFVSQPVGVQKRFVDASGVLQGPRTELRGTVGQPGLEAISA